MKLKILSRFRKKASRLVAGGCFVCEGYGTIPAGKIFTRSPRCTCGAGWYDELTLHDIHCDTVPCPFCQLDEDAQNAMENAARGGVLA